MESVYFVYTILFMIYGVAATIRMIELEYTNHRYKTVLDSLTERYEFAVNTLYDLRYADLDYKQRVEKAYLSALDRLDIVAVAEEYYNKAKEFTLACKPDSKTTPEKLSALESTVLELSDKYNELTQHLAEESNKTN